MPHHRPYGASEAAINPAASLVLLRFGGGTTRVLLGMRGTKAHFMPKKFVFPGGRVDADEADHGTKALLPLCEMRLGLATQPVQTAQNESPPHRSGHYVAAARRELHEETGLYHTLRPQSLRYIFRAITPPGFNRRFDAHFFLGQATDIEGNLDDFSAASGELSQLAWLELEAAKALDLPFVTAIILAEAAHIAAGGVQAGVPFFDNRTHQPSFRRILGDEPKGDSTSSDAAVLHHSH